ncbi:MAG: SBBP repeat-containing protein [Bacteroidia bacterium]
MLTFYKNYFWIGFIFLSVFSQDLSAQIYVNQEWESITALPDTTVKWSASTLDPSENLIVCGNTLVTNEGVNVLITKYDREGVKLWEVDYHYDANSNEYGIAVTTDESGNIFVASALFTGTVPESDYLILKYNSVANFQWDEIFDGSGSGNDLPSSITLDSEGNVYVTGTSEGTNTGYDIFTIKLDGNGVSRWSARYDRDSLDDGGVQIQVDSNGESTIIGGSGEATNDWDYVTLQYDSDGNLNEEEIVLNPGFGFDKPSAMVKDHNGNIYITGSSSEDDINYNIQTVKLDTSFQVVWTKTYGGSSDDGAFAIDVDASGNIYLGGYTTVSGQVRYTIIKYSSDEISFGKESGKYWKSYRFDSE